MTPDDCPDACPLCGSDLRGDPIPEQYRQEGWYGSSTHYSRRIGVEVQGIYDGVLYWQCPDCGGRWHRWPEGSHLALLAERYVKEAVA